MRHGIRDVLEGLEAQGYVADRTIATTVHLALTLERPLLVEGAAGVGKTEIAKALSAWRGLELVRLQCYEGLDVHMALYEWNYQKQLLRMRLESDPDAGALEEAIYGPDYLLERPLLQAIRSERPVVLLIDEIDRADEEFEAFLLEVLSDFQVTIPELGTVKARSRPLVVLTSNGTRVLSDALRRRCLYLWIDYPDSRKELEILRRRHPGLEPAVAREAVELVQRLRAAHLSKPPGIAETIDFGAALEALETRELEPRTVRDALGTLIKDPLDFDALSEEALARLLEPGSDADSGANDGP